MNISTHQRHRAAAHGRAVFDRRDLVELAETTADEPIVATYPDTFTGRIIATITGAALTAMLAVIFFACYAQAVQQ